jgi:hypothetical protein
VREESSTREREKGKRGCVGLLSSLIGVNKGPMSHICKCHSKTAYKHINNTCVIFHVKTNHKLPCMNATEWCRQRVCSLYIWKHTCQALVGQWDALHMHDITHDVMH